MDKYSSFSEIRNFESPDSFAISVDERVASGVIVLAPHGGRIEPHTSDIARRIAGDSFSCYVFEGRKPANNRDLHLTSHRFDEPTALALVARHRWVLAIHGFTAATPRVLLGGLDEALMGDLARHLAQAGIDAETANHPYPGREPRNICNRGSSGAGVQAELSMPFRTSPDAVDRFVLVAHKLLAERSLAG